MTFFSRPRTLRSSERCACFRERYRTATVRRSVPCANSFTAFERAPFSDEEQRWGARSHGCLHLARRQRKLNLGTESDAARAPTIRKSTMKRKYDFSKAKRGPVISVPKGKTRITIQLDED